MDNPLVTVYIPTHNRSNLLQRALLSVIQQDYPALEIIVVDDGSEFGTHQENLRICEQFQMVRYFYLPESNGACAARNYALAHANGEFITGLDDDDEFLPGRISAFVNYWQSNADVSLLCTGYYFVLPGGKTISSGRKAMWINERRIKHINDVGNQVFTRTAFLKAIDGFDPNLVACQDYDVWLRLITTFGKAYRLGLQNYVVHQEHEFPRISTFNKRLQGHQQLIDKHQNQLSSAQLKSQRFFRLLYGGEQNVWYLLRLAGWRHSVVLLKMLLARRLTRKPATE